MRMAASDCGRTVRRRIRNRAEATLRYYDDQERTKQDIPITEDGQGQVEEQDEDNMQEKRDVNDTEKEEAIDDDKRKDSTSLGRQLARWAVKHNINQSATTDLLRILTDHDIPALPKASRTLLKTPRSLKLKDTAGGKYYHFGIRTSLMHALHMDGVAIEDIPDGTEFKLHINVDGLPAGKSCNSSLWPISAIAYYIMSQDDVESQERATRVFYVGMWFGYRGKPSSVHEYLTDFTDDYLQVQNDGLALVDGKTASLKLRAVIADAPARSFATATRNHGHKKGCPKCEEEGYKRAHRMIFPAMNGRIRTDDSFLRKRDKHHHSIGPHSPLTRTGIGMITNIPSDYMHMVLGVVLKMLHLLTKKKCRHKLKGDKILHINRRLSQYALTCPSEFARKPRSLRHLDRFKATECRTFLCYTGLLALRNKVSNRIYNHFKTFVCAIRILLNKKQAANRELCEYAGNLLKEYALEFRNLFGYRHMVYNVHCLSHIGDDALRHGHLDRFSSFPYESSFGQLKKYIRTPNATLAQVVNRLEEKRLLQLPHTTEARDMHCMHSHTDGPLPDNDDTDYSEYGLVDHKNIRYGTDMTDRAIFIDEPDCGVGVIRNVLKKENSKSAVLLVSFFDDQEDMFDKPFPSSNIGIYKVSNLNDSTHIKNVEECMKVWLMTMSDEQMAAFILNHEVL